LRNYLSIIVIERQDMKHIIDETETIAYDHLKGFGFNDEQMKALIHQGKIDLQKELSKLKALLTDTEQLSLDEINNSLHALKGLFFQLGNHQVAEQLNEIRSYGESKVILQEISELLFGKE